MATVRDLDNRIQNLDEQIAVVNRLIQAAQEGSQTREVMQEITGQKFPEFELNGLSNTLIMYKAFLREMRDTTLVGANVDIKLVSKLL